MVFMSAINKENLNNMKYVSLLLYASCEPAISTEKIAILKTRLIITTSYFVLYVA